MRLPILPAGFEKHDFIGAYKREPNPRKRIRLLGLSYIQKGKSFIEAGELLKVGRKTVSRWLGWFVEGGFENLKDAERSGAKPNLSPGCELCFQQAVLELQRKRNGGSVSGEDIRELLATQFNAEYSLSGVYD
jgi:transposase